MERYNYYKAVADDVRDYIEENGITLKDYKDADELKELLQNELWTADSVTVNEMKGDTNDDYINRRQLYSDLCALLMEARNKFGDEETNEIVRNEFPNEFVEEYAAEVVNYINEDMGAYLNAPSHHIVGNFCNIGYDYPGDVKAMVQRLNDGELSEQADENRQFLTQWFYDAIGTAGVVYNFQTLMSEKIGELCDD